MRQLKISKQFTNRENKSLDKYLNEISKVPMIDAQEEVELARRIREGDQAALEKLPGVGRKTANVVRNMAFGAPTVAVDTHIFRIGNRTGLAPGKTTLAVELSLLKRTPPEYMLHAHHWLILHGRYLCKARKPECWRCPVADLCRHRDKIPAP